MLRERWIGLEFWLLACLAVAQHPRALELRVALPLLAITGLVCSFLGRWEPHRLAVLVTGLAIMTPLSLWLPHWGVSPWWSMTVPLVACAMALFRRYAPVPVWAIFLLWVFAIGLVSGGSGGAGGWGDWFARLLGISSTQAEVVVWWIRKGIHFFYYGVMAALAVRVCDHDRNPRPILAAALWTLGIAAFDESRQLFTPYRSGSALDFVLDAAGAAVFLGLWHLRRSRR